MFQLVEEAPDQVALSEALEIDAPNERQLPAPDWATPRGQEGQLWGTKVGSQRKGSAAALVLVSAFADADGNEEDALTPDFRPAFSAQ